MDIRQQLAVTHSRANANLILEWLLADEARTQVLMEVVRDPDPTASKLVQRAAMVLGDLGRKRKDWLLPHHAEMLSLAAGSSHPALPRAVARYFAELPLSKVSEENLGVLMDLSFRYLANREGTVAVRVFSMITLGNFAMLYPDLRDEVRGLIEVELEEGVASPGFRSRGVKILRAFANQRTE